jgi:hypothetical protein
VFEYLDLSGKVVDKPSSTRTWASFLDAKPQTHNGQAIIDSYLCLVHLTTGIVVEALFNAFATTAFFKFMIFSVFEMRYLLLIWKARRPQGFQVLTPENSDRSIGPQTRGCYIILHHDNLETDGAAQQNPQA